MVPVGGASDPVFGDQTGLAETARSDDAHEPGCCNEIGQRAEIIVAPDDRGRRPDEVVSVGWEDPERRELGREVRRGDLEQLDGVVEVTDPIATERREHLPARVARLFGCLGGDHDLATVPGVHHSRRLVHGERDVVIPVRRGEARMNAHPHPDHRVGRPRFGCEIALRLRARFDGGHRSRERDEERVSVGLHLAPAPRRPRRPEDLLMTLQQRGIPVTDPPEQLRRRLDVREHEGHQSRRERPGRPYHPISIVPCEPQAFWLGTLRPRIEPVEQAVHLEVGEGARVRQGAGELRQAVGDASQAADDRDALTGEVVDVDRSTVRRADQLG